GASPTALQPVSTLGKSSFPSAPRRATPPSS
ncbi:hypothetical protein AB1N83_014318, partial [Pleurotus pulmonarius]